MEKITKSGHIGQKINRIRELRGMKQNALAAKLGISQQSVSLLSQSEFLEEEKLERVARALGVTKQTILEFSEEKALSFFNHTRENGAGCLPERPREIAPGVPPSMKKIFELYDEKERLYERLILTEKEKREYLEKLIYKRQDSLS